MYKCRLWLDEKYIYQHVLARHLEVLFLVQIHSLFLSLCLLTDYSPGRYAPCWCVHPPPAQWREKLWSEAQQTVRPQDNAAGHTKVLRDTCGPALPGMNNFDIMW